MSATVSHESLDRTGRRRIIVVAGYQTVLYALLFAGTGTFSWPAGWIYVIASLTGFLTIGLYVARKNPEVVNERGRSSQDTKTWDKLFAALYAPLLFLLPLVAGLDWRFSWSEMAPAWQIVGFVLLVPGIILPYAAMLANRFLVTTVRIQTEREQTPVTTGPYRYVRHPMYVGAILAALGGPLLLGSWWALLVGAVSSALVIARTALEDRTLQEELPGYAEYVARVRYRLLPGVW